MIDWEDLVYMLEIGKTKLISRQLNDPLVDHFSIEKFQELIAQKYY